jgi:cardiolipin synthase
VIRRRIKLWPLLSWPNRISILRLLLVAPFVILLMNHPHWAYGRYVALAIFVVMALSDLLDGLLARRLNARTRLGAILDPLADKALIICAVILLSLPDSAVAAARLPNYVVVAIVGKDLWVVGGFVVVYLVTDRFRVRPTALGKVCTVSQLAMVVAVLIAPDLNRLKADWGSALVLGMGWLAAGLSVLAVISYTRLGLSFVVREDKPLDDNHRLEAGQDEPHRGHPGGPAGRSDDRPGGR